MFLFDILVGCSSSMFLLDVPVGSLPENIEKQAKFLKISSGGQVKEATSTENIIVSSPILKTYSRPSFRVIFKCLDVFIYKDEDPKLHKHIQCKA